MKERFKFWGVIALLVLCLAGLWATSGMDSSQSTASSKSVSTNMARLPAGEKHYMTHQTGITLEIWQVVYQDGVVQFDSKNALYDKHHTGKLCGVGCVTHVSMGALRGSIDVSLRSDGAVNVTWPLDWRYLPGNSKPI